MNDFHFMRPEWFLVLIPLLLLLYWLVRRHQRSRSWQAVCDPELLPHLLLGRSVRRANWPFWLLMCGLLLAVLALAGPAWQRQPQPLFRQQSALVVLFDLSRSMQVADLKPSRFLRARLKIEDLLRQRQEGQTALIVFAADAFTVTPLTEDRHTIEALLKSLDPEMMPVQGSDPARAIQLGQKLLKQAGLKTGRLLLVTDEDRPELSLKAAAGLAEQGFELSVLGVASPEGAPIPQSGGGFFKDGAGNLVLPRLNQAGLEELARAGGGNYRTLTIDDSDLAALLAGLGDRGLDQASDAKAQQSSGMGDRWREEGVWLLFPLCLLAAFGFRRGWLLVLPLLLLVPPSAEALSWSELWQTPDQRAAQSFAEQDYPEAAAQFADPRWKASALFRSGQFEAAAKELADPQTADDWYNQGNALAKAGDRPAAFKSYEQALELEPDHGDAQINKELVESALQQQEEQKQQGDKSEQGDQQKESDEGEKSQDQQSPSEAQEDQAGKPGQQSESDPLEAESKPAPPPESEPAEEPAEASKPQAEDEAKDASEAEATDLAEAQEETPETAEQRETRLLLQQIPDDPGGLLRRKFLYQYRQRGQQRETDRSW